MDYRIAVCDDCPVDCDYVQRLLQAWAQKNNVIVSIEKYPSAESFLFQYAVNKSYDILLLDIEMAGMDGVTLAKTIRKDNELIQIVFISGYSDYITEGYEVSALHYLVKPVREEKLYSVLDRAVHKLQRNEKYLHLELPNEIVRIPLSKIGFLEVQHNYVTIHAARDYVVRQTLSHFEAELDEYFYRIGRTVILNLRYIRRVTRNEIYLKNGSVLHLPRGYYEILNRAIIKYL